MFLKHSSELLLSTARRCYLNKLSNKKVGLAKVRWTFSIDSSVVGKLYHFHEKEDIQKMSTGITVEKTDKALERIRDEAKDTSFVFSFSQV